MKSSSMWLKVTSRSLPLTVLIMLMVLTADGDMGGLSYRAGRLGLPHAFTGRGTSLKT